MGRGAAARRAAEGGVSRKNRRDLNIPSRGDVFDPVTSGLRGNQYAPVLIDMSTGQVMVGRWAGARGWYQLWAKYGGAGAFSNAYTARIETRVVNGRYTFTLVGVSRAAGMRTMTPAMRSRILGYLRRAGATGTFRWQENGKWRTARIT